MSALDKAATLVLLGKESIGRTEAEGHQRIVLIILSGLRFLNCQMKMPTTLCHKVVVMTEKTKA